MIILAYVPCQAEQQDVFLARRRLPRERRNCRTQPLKFRRARRLTLHLQPPTHCVNGCKRLCRLLNTARQISVSRLFTTVCWLIGIATRRPQESSHGEGHCCTHLRSNRRHQGCKQNGYRQPSLCLLCLDRLGTVTQPERFPRLQVPSGSSGEVSPQGVSARLPNS